jgi:CspA family cold shock protein
MPQGVIKKLVQDRGFGFIGGEHGDVFFHHSTVSDQGFDDLQIGQKVQYELQTEGGRGQDKGPRASSVTPES